MIGLTTYKQRAQTGVWDVTAAFLPAVYFEAVQRAGGIPVLLPPQPADADIVDRVLDGIDGLIITGGVDVDPARYGQPLGEHTDRPQLERDAWEDALLSAAIDRELPFLGICRGMQVLNVNRGGTLHQHLPDVVGDDRFRVGKGEFATNVVETEPGSEIDALVGAKLPVKSYHHQGVDAVGAGLRVTARSAEGIAQAVELEGVPFGVAVQWHPEEDAADDARLFAGLVDAARTFAGARA
ncbi:gamma-glutamyl-gamma-aminobutyrate hydrolase family protein [Pseudolysinimonas sp.]|uniref:gamma-glutamyl-gamma-aminobutyrate hydrolase family protein n=1 Tax=Pseudolysinimonas sp. TaxID=2680009 RepID=UPI00378465B7